jgi:hypothetical protein
MRIHRIVWDSLSNKANNFRFLKCPSYFDEGGKYIMMKVLTDHPLVLSDEDSRATCKYINEVEEELLRFWQFLWTEHGLAAYDFDLYQVNEGRFVYIFDFDKFGFRITSGPSWKLKMPNNVDMDDTTFFKHQCFPLAAKQKLGIVSSVQ